MLCDCDGISSLLPEIKLAVFIFLPAFYDSLCLMQGDSETETESEGERVHADSFVQNGSASGTAPHITFDGLGGVLEAIQRIKQCNLDSVEWEGDLQDDVHSAANTVIHFVDHYNIISDGFPSTNLSIFVALVDIPFLQILFRHRKILKATAIQSARFSHTGQLSGPVLSWVDVFISKLCKLVITIAAGSFTNTYKETLSEGLKLQKDQSYFRAATQLPDHWEGLPGVVASHEYSPAAQRLALRLLFAAYVMKPQLNPFCPWVGDSTSPTELLTDLYRGLNRVSSRAIPPSAEYRCTEEKTEGAMFISLFSVIYRKVHGSQPHSCPSPLWPKTLGRLLDLIEFSMTQDSSPSLIPCGKLNESQVILLRWGEVVPWAWVMWRDGRLWNSEQIRFLTSMWFFHMDTSHIVTILNKPERNKPVGAYLRFKLLENTAASAGAILQLLQQISLHLRNSRELQNPLCPIFLTVIRRTCWAVVQLLQSNWETLDPNVEGRLPQYCASMLLVFCSLQDSEEEILAKQLISEALTLTESHSLASGVRHLMVDKTFLERLDGVILRSRCLVTNGRSNHQPKTALRAVSVTLDLLVIIWKNKLVGLVISGSACLFLRAVLQTVVESSSDSTASSILRNSLLSALAVCEYSSAEANWSEQSGSLWRHVSSSKRCDFATARKFVCETNMPPFSLSAILKWHFLGSS